MATKEKKREPKPKYLTHDPSSVAGVEQSVIFSENVAQLTVLSRDTDLLCRLRLVSRRVRNSLDADPCVREVSYYRRRYTEAYACYLSEACRQWYKSETVTYTPRAGRCKAEALTELAKMIEECNDPTTLPPIRLIDIQYLGWFLTSQTKERLMKQNVHKDNQTGMITYVSNPGRYTGVYSFAHYVTHSGDCPNHRKIGWQSSMNDRQRMGEDFLCPFCCYNMIDEFAPRFLSQKEQQDLVINRLRWSYTTPEEYLQQMRGWFDRRKPHPLPLDAGSLVDVLTLDPTLFSKIVTHQNTQLVVGRRRMGAASTLATLTDYVTVMKHVVQLKDPVTRLRNTNEERWMRGEFCDRGTKMMSKAERAVLACTKKTSKVTVSNAEYLLNIAESRQREEALFFSLWMSK